MFIAASSLQGEVSCIAEALERHRHCEEAFQRDDEAISEREIASAIVWVAGLAMTDDDMCAAWKD
ncbi:MAG: hypothetical protein A3G87_00305 [Omnitrophica bacterium RIFCSPLOWO2_12_FULL_50_11]|nr:MAG: hypothetical protein A3G87_00305 [Omnitrophica bacterium RIFCSPLOWO2_12_FULL_50_11]